MTPNRSVAFHTFGCKLNFSETSTISRQFEKAGFALVDFKESADVYVINTCSVTENADKKCKQMVRSISNRSPESKVVIVGCYAQLKPEQIIKIKGVDLVVGASEKFNILEHLEKENTSVSSKITEVKTFEPAYSVGDRTRSFFKVQDGCDYFCSFCTIPLARGTSRNASIKKTIEVAKKVAQTQVKEVVLTGVNIGDFGKSTNETFFELIQQLDKIEGIDRFRISSIEPNLLSNEIINFVAHSNKFVPHFHIPLQSGNDYLLTKMRRRYDTKLYTDRIAHINKTIKNCCIGVDVIVGYPEETDERFEETFKFLENLEISYLHVFPYSERNNTTAIRNEHVIEPKIRADRSKRLRALSKKKKQHFYAKNQGAKRTVLFEGENNDGFMQGFTDNYLSVHAPFDQQKINQLIDVELNKLEDCKFLF